jgi:hypothetical protein
LMPNDWWPLLTSRKCAKQLRMRNVMELKNEELVCVVCSCHVPGCNRRC